MRRPKRLLFKTPPISVVLSFVGFLILGNVFIFYLLSRHNGAPKEIVSANHQAIQLLSGPISLPTSPREAAFIFLENSYHGGSQFSCFAKGTEAISAAYGCICKRGYSGSDCGIPDIINESNSMNYEIRRRTKPVRIINGFPLNREEDLLIARLHELASVVDAFIIAESNYTQAGTPKETHFKDNYRHHPMVTSFMNKIVHYVVDHLPAGTTAENMKWEHENYLRTTIGTVGLSGILELEPEDIIVVNDADEIPDARILAFLKHYKISFPENLSNNGVSQDVSDFPIAFAYRWSIFGFYWVVNRPSISTSACSIQLLSSLFNYDTNALRQWDHPVMKFLIGASSNPPVQLYSAPETTTSRVDSQRATEPSHQEFSIKSPLETFWAGWHCSWCLPVHAIVNKLDSATPADKAGNWHEDPERKTPRYIRNLITEGLWFDETRLGDLASTELDTMYAPKFILENSQRYLSIVKKPIA